VLLLLLFFPVSEGTAGRDIGIGSGSGRSIVSMEKVVMETDGVSLRGAGGGWRRHSLKVGWA